MSNLFFWMSLNIRWRRKIFLTYLSTLLLELSWINFYHVVVKRPFSTRNLLESKNWSEIWSLHAKVLRSIITLNLPKARPNCTCLRILLFNLNKKKMASTETTFFEFQFDNIKTKQFSNVPKLAFKGINWVMTLNSSTRLRKDLIIISNHQLRNI